MLVRAQAASNCRAGLSDLPRNSTILYKEFTGCYRDTKATRGYSLALKGGAVGLTQELYNPIRGVTRGLQKD